jgi:hypothetical protein
MLMRFRFLAAALVAAILVSCSGGSGGNGNPPGVIDGTGVDRIDSVMNDVMRR